MVNEENPRGNKEIKKNLKMKIFNRGENTEAYDVYTSGKLKMIRGENSQK